MQIRFCGLMESTATKNELCRAKTPLFKVLRFGAWEKIVVSGPLFLANQMETRIIGDAIST